MSEKVWAEFFRKLLKHIAENSRGNAFYLARVKNEKISLNVKKLVKIIYGNNELYEEFVKACRETGITNNPNVLPHFTLRNIMYHMFRRKVEPIYSLMRICLQREYITISELRELVGEAGG